MDRPGRVGVLALSSAALLAVAACSGRSGDSSTEVGSTFAASIVPSPTALSPEGSSASTSASAFPTATPTRTSTIAFARAVLPSLGKGADLKGRRPFPPTNAWNTKIDTAPADPNSAALIASIGGSGHLHPDFGADYDGGPFGIAYVVVPGSQKKVTVRFDYVDESDPGPYPIPKTAPVEGGSSSDGDRHVLVVDRDHWTLYELYAAYPHGGGTSWTAGSGAVFNLTTGRARPAGWTSADAAGLPIFPGLVRYDEVSAGRISHALRFTVARTRAAYVAPARHFASTDTSRSRPPMGMRVRLKSSFDITGYPKQARVVLQALKTYGMIVADNGSNWFISGAPDKRWNDEALGALKRVPGSAFEVVKMGKITTSR
jgi:hypothetical protein